GGCAGKILEGAEARVQLSRGARRVVCVDGGSDPRELEKAPRTHDGGREGYGVEATTMIDKWERSVPVHDVPIWTRPFIAMCGLGGLALLFVTYRENSQDSVPQAG